MNDVKGTMMGDRQDGNFNNLDERLAPHPVLEGVRHLRLEGAILRVECWQVDGRDPVHVALDGMAEAFIVPITGTVRVRADDLDDAVDVSEGALAFLPDAWDGRYGFEFGTGRFVVAGMPSETARAVGDHSSASPEVLEFDAVLEDKYEGWRFYSRDGEYMTAALSYRTAPPNKVESLHTHPGEQFNVPLAGGFSVTVGDDTQTLGPGWITHIPPDTLHTASYDTFPYFQVFLATPPRGKDYEEFLRTRYQAPA